MSMLLLHLIEIRSLFIQGGEGKLRQATLAFAAAIILCQRLAAEEGRAYARTMKLAVGIAITLFALDHAYKYRGPIHHWITFPITCSLYALLWWVGDKITAACAVESSEDIAEAAESGIWSRLKIRTKRKGRAPAPGEADSAGAPGAALAQPPPLSKKKKKAMVFAPRPTDLRTLEDRQKNPQLNEPEADPEIEAKWTQKITGRHPGLVLLWFSLVAIPAFGLGMLFYDKADVGAHIRLAIFVFIYVWCAFSLLCLASLNQFRAYLDQRSISLPEIAGLTWLGLGFSILTIVVALAFFIPQPPSPSARFVRDQVLGYWGEQREHYRQSARGQQEVARAHEAQNAKADEPVTQKEINRKRNEMYWRKMVKEEIGEPYMINEEEREKWAKEMAQPGVKAFHWFIKMIVWIALLGSAFVLLVLLISAWTSITENIARLRWMRRKKVPVRPAKKQKRKLRGELALSEFRRFTNPFAGPYSETDGNAVVRYTWMAFIAMCADGGAPCPPEQTPREFVAARPEPLKGFEEPADFIARLYTYSEFSGQEVSPSALEEVKAFWNKMQSHASAVVAA